MKMNELFDDGPRPDGAAARVTELEGLIRRYQDSYYNGEAEVSDAEFDGLWDELKALAPDSPLLAGIGADSGSFEKVRHVMPMGSQEKAADPEEFRAWAEKHAYSEYLVEYKLDGASLELQYRHGKLLRAVTRGDGAVGDDVTENARKMSGVLPVLERDGRPEDFTGGIRGEVIMTHDVHRSKFSDKANCRNAANGIMKRKDGAGSEWLTLIVYDAFASEGTRPFSDEEEKVRWLGACGFRTAPLEICRSAQAVVEYRARVMEARKSLDYDIDGLVVKERRIDDADAARARPDRQIAFKFSLEEAVSVLRAVEWSRSGATYTPVAVFDGVELNGTTVRRASLANPDTMRALGVRIGCKVVVVKRGEIIPKIEGTVHDDGAAETPVEFPSACGTCGTPLTDGGSRLFCPNPSCPERVLHRLLKWVQTVDIRDLGETLVGSLFRAGKVRSISDFYRLTAADLVPFFLTEESIAADRKSLGAEKVIRSIAAHRTMPLSVFVAGFDIEGVGALTVEKLAAAGYDTLEKLLSMTEAEAAAVYGLADIMARAVTEGLAENAEEMRALAAAWIHIAAPEGGALSGKSFCFTGELRTMRRSDAERLVKDAGGQCKSAVTKGLSYLVTNDTSSGSSKNRKAAEFGIPVIDEREFLKLIGNA